MSEAPVSPGPGRSPLRGAVESLGRAAEARGQSARLQVSFVGGLAALLGTTARWCYRGLFVPGIKLRRSALAGQMVRIGTRAVPIVLLVQVFIGIILALQMAPTLASYGQLERVADVIGIAIVRELGPLITAIV
ncbi:MAG: ABC transporter permease, partial [Planctomycetota bacterium]